MAISYTPEQYNTIKTVADKMGSGNENFKSAVNKKYGEGAYDSYLGYKAPPPTAGVNASASALTQTGSIPAPEVSPNGMQGLASSLVNKATSVPSNVVDNTGANTALVQTPEEKAWQLKQDAFNKANPVGTKTEDIQPSKAPTTPVTTPQATVTPTTTTTPVKTQKNGADSEGINYNSSVGREEQIGTNLTNITAQTPELLTDRTKYDKAFGYATADEGKKALLDSFFANGKKAMDNVNTIKQYAGASVDDLSASLLDGSISPSVKNILMSDPVMQAKLSKAEALNKVNDKKVNTTAVGEKQTLETLASSPTIANAMENGELSGEEVNALTSTPEQIALKKKRDIEFEDLNKKTAIWDSIEQDIDTKTYGKNITASDKAQMVANARKTLLPELNRAERAYNNTTAQLTELKKDALGLLETNLSLYKEKKASAAKVEADKVNFEQQKEIARYQNELSNKNITTEKIVDPATGKTVLVNSKTGDIVASYNTGLKSEAMTPYEQAQIDIKKEEAKAGKNINIQKIGENEYGYLDSEGKLVRINKEATSEIPTGTRDVTGYLNAAKASVNDVYGSCGKFANDYSGVGSEPGGDDSIAGRTKTYTDKEPVVGGMAFFTGGGYDKKNGHVAVVTGRSADGKTITVKESNYNGDNKVTERTIPTTFVKGYYNNTPLATKTTGMAKEDYSDERIVNLLSVAPVDSKKRVTWLAQNNLSENDYADYKAGAMPPTASQFKTISKTISDIDALLSSPDITMATGVSGNLVLPNTTAKDWQNKFNSLKAKLTLGNLGVMKGALSDKDMEMINKASSSINATGWNASSEQAIKDGLLEIKNSIINKENLSGLFASQKEQATQPTQTLGKVDEKLKANIDLALKTTSKEEIIKQLKAKGINPSIYGL